MPLDTLPLTEAAPEAPAIAAEPWPAPRVAWYAVCVFGLALMCAQLDQGIITLLVGPIKRDLKLTDTEMSFLLGFAFVFFYLFVGLPLSRLVDTRRRKNILTVGITVWSAMTALCGVAQSFAQLFLFRVGVGAGESINGPATFSMIADYFPREKLPRAIAVLNLGAVLGGGVSMLVGAVVIGLLSHVRPIVVPGIGVIHSWQLVFFIVGLPGLAVALLMSTVPEPPRRGRLARGPGAAKPIPIRTAAAFLWRNRAIYGPMFLGLAASSVSTYGGMAWRPAFFQRTYGWSPQQYGLTSGVISLLLSPIGLFLGATIAERFGRTRDDANLRVVAISSLAALPFAIAAPLAPTPWISIGCSAMAAFAAMMGAPTQNAALQSVTPNEMRGQITALYLFVFTVIGSGLGPTFIALITDDILRSEAGLRYALAGAAAVMGPISFLILLSGVAPYGREITRLKALERAGEP